jgi:hypothetical protein
MQYLNLPRMAYYVDKATYRGEVTGWIKRLSKRFDRGQIGTNLQETAK